MRTTPATWPTRFAISSRLYGIVTLPVSLTAPLSTCTSTSSKIVKCGYCSTCFCTARKVCRFSESAANAGAPSASINAAAVKIFLNMVVAPEEPNLHCCWARSLPGKIAKTFRKMTLAHVRYSRAVAGRYQAIRSEQHHRADAGADQQDLPHRGCVGAAAVKSGNEIRHRHVKKARRRQRQAVRPQRRHEVEGDERHQCADGAGESRQHVQQEGAAARVAGVKQYREVAELLRNLVRGYRNGGAEAERHRRHDGRSDDRPVHEVVKRVADDDPNDAAVVDLAIVRVAVPPKHQLFQDEEQHHADKQCREQPC